MTGLKEKIRAIARFLRPMFLTMAVMLFLFRVVLCLAYIPSGSMMDTIPEKCLALALRTHGAKPLRRGDIVIFNAHGHTTAEVGDKVDYYAKRVVGLPGDTVEIIGGITYINGAPYDESGYLREPPADEDHGPFSVPAGCYFMMGDNRNNSFDSRAWDVPYVRQEEVLGVIFLHIF